MALQRLSEMEAKKPLVQIVHPTEFTFFSKQVE